MRTKTAKSQLVVWADTELVAAVRTEAKSRRLSAAEFLRQTLTNRLDTGVIAAEVAEAAFDRYAGRFELAIQEMLEVVREETALARTEQKKELQQVLAVLRAALTGDQVERVAATDTPKQPSSQQGKDDWLTKKSRPETI
ncbi:MAG: hypothetical protein J0I77_01995 [Rudaea sp.]|uniref:hypothetical protein n=1 Tax=unclassified Rudaea TaxID=2627037 RepID=UPI0010F7A553|nr:MULTISPECIES: hypothetical protein [unclassified Rudaea]MBN8884467.1 hypothetical protein [Rudaea sp.]